MVAAATAAEQLSLAEKKMTLLLEQPVLAELCRIRRCLRPTAAAEVY